MNVVLALSIVTLALQLGAVLTALTIARAPGWRRVRIVAALAGTAGVYSVVRMLGELLPNTAEVSGVLTSANIVVGAAHLSGWLWYTYSDGTGSWESLPRWVRRLSPGVVGVCALAALSGQVVASGDAVSVTVDWLHISSVRARLSPIGILVAAQLVGLLTLSLVEQVRQARRGVPGASAIVGGFVIFALCGVEEIIVAAGWFEFIYIGELGYLGLVVPVTTQLLQRFRDDARRLADLSARLSAEVLSAESERDAARETFLAQERFAALGRIASGVGHEINNPLQYLTLNLEELRDRHLADPSGEAQEALAQSFDAAERIRRIVDGMRAYARTTVPQLEPLDLRDIVRAALRKVGPQLQLLPPARQRLDPTPLVLGDEGKLVQAVVNAIVNSAFALERLAGRPPALEIRTYTAPNGEAALEVRDNGPGFPAELLPRLGEPFVTTRATVGGSGLGLFVVRGIVDAHGGTLQLENARGGGALLRILLPPAPHRG